MGTLSPTQLQTYLNRIDATHLDRSVPSTSLLFHLHWAHLRKIPFENLSLRVPKAETTHPATADLNRSYQKLCEASRGGYCFEHNGVFEAALRSLGFDVYSGGARVVLPSPPPQEGEHKLTNYAAHRICIVTIVEKKGNNDETDGVQQYLADVGFGGEVCALPLGLPSDPHGYASFSYGKDTVSMLKTQPNHHEYDNLPLKRLEQYRIRPGLLESSRIPSGDDTAREFHKAGYYLQKWSVRGNDWKDLYFFDMRKATDEDFVVANHHLVTSSDSLFRNVDMIGQLTQEGRSTAFNNSFRVFDEFGELVSEDVAEGREEFFRMVESRFNLKIE